MAARSRARIDNFDDFVIGELPDLAHLGNEVLNRVRGMPLAEKALTALYLTHLREAPPAHSNPNPNPNPNQVAARSRARIDDFDDFAIAELPDLAHLGNEVLSRL